MVFDLKPKMENIEPIVFRSPFAAMLCGPSQSGKTVLLIKILQNVRQMVHPPPDRIMYCYAESQEIFNTVPNIELHRGIPDSDMFDPNKNNMLILDDLMEKSENNPDVQKLFTVDAHHKNISIFLISQNLFSKGKCARTISLNCNYLIIFNNPRDRQQIQCLARQMYPRTANFLIEAFDDATETQNFGYLFLDLTQKTKQKNRIQTCILPNETRIIYQPK